MNDKGGYVFYPFTAEITPSVELEIIPFEPEKYFDLVCQIIRELRRHGDFVVASSEYENLIVKKTGWNWSEETPVHPT
jgi:hypothetical protein